jgi:hypothetical protein
VNLQIESDEKGTTVTPTLPLVECEEEVAWSQKTIFGEPTRL